MALAICTMKNIFPLHTKTQAYHLTYPMCYSQCHNGDICSIKEVTYVDEWNHIRNWRA